MKRFLLALIVVPAVAAAQKPESHWLVEMGTGVTASSSLNMQTFWGAISASKTIGEAPTAPSSNDYWWMEMLGLPPGIVAARKAQDTGRTFASVRASAYTLGTASGALGGAYVGAGVAAPMILGGLALELSVHSYLFEPTLVGPWWRP